MKILEGGTVLWFPQSEDFCVQQVAGVTESCDDLVPESTYGRHVLSRFIIGDAGD